MRCLRVARPVPDVQSRAPSLILAASGAPTQADIPTRSATAQRWLSVRQSLLNGSAAS